MKKRAPDRLSHRRQSRAEPGEQNPSQPEEPEADRGREADRPSELTKKGWRDILLRTKKRLAEDNLSIVAAGAAFFALLALIPGLAALISIYGLVADPQAIQDQLDSIGHILPPETLSLLKEQMTRIASEDKAVGWAAAFSILFALWSGSKAISNLILALNIAYNENEARGFFKRSLLSIGLTLAAIFTVILAISLVVLLPIVLGKIGLGVIAETTVNILRWPLLIALALGGLSLLYRYGPNRNEAKWRWVTWGAGIATVIWIAASALFSFYVSSFGNYNKTYGSLGAAVILLMWFYISAYAILLGAELNSEMEHQTAKDSTKDPEKAMGSRGAHAADTLGEVP